MEKTSGPKMVVCDICGQTVTKRSTVVLSCGPHAGKRACRVHPETQEAQNLAVLDKLDTEMKKQKALKVLQDQVDNHNLLDGDCSSMGVIMDTCLVRALCTYRGVPLSVAMMMLRWNKHRTWNHLNKVKEEIEQHGGPIISSDEALGSLMAWGHLQKLCAE